MKLTNITLIDYVIHQKFCNFQCQYCIAENSSKEDERLREKIKYTDGCEIDLRLRAIENYVKADILQISGGELFLIQNIDEFILKNARKYKKLIVITNGSLLNEKLISEFSKYKNIVFGISLDGHTLDMNIYRFKSVRWLNKIWENMKLLKKYDVSFFINTVLHNKNEDYLKDFFSVVSKKFCNVPILPIILRGNNKDKYLFHEDKAKLLYEIGHDEEMIKTGTVVPQYFDLLYDMIKNPSKKLTCYISQIVIELLHDGDIYCCPLYWVKLIGNVIKDNENKIKEQIESDRVYKLMLSKSSKLECCKGCLSHYDIINLFLNGKICREDYEKIPIFNNPEITDRLLKAKENI